MQVIPTPPIIERAAQHGSRFAVHSNGTQTTYQGLVDWSALIAARLLGQTDDLREARIAFLVPPEDSYVAVQWSIWRAGGIAVPLSLSATEKELAYTIEDSQTSAVVTTRELANKLTAVCQQR